MEIKRKTCDIRTRKKHLFLDISSTNIDTIVPSLYQCVEIRRMEVFWLLSHSLPNLVGHHLRFSNVLERISQPSCELLYAKNTYHRKQENFFMKCSLCWTLLSTKTHNKMLFFGSIHLKHSSHFDYWNKPLNMRICVCYLYCHEAGLCCYLLIHV
jgi:hypothetical protein